MNEIRHFLRIRTTPEVVFKALNTKEGIEGWWTEEVKREDDVWHLTFTGQWPTDLKIIKEIEDTLVEWEGRNGDIWMDTRMKFELEAEGDNTTILRFSHSGFSKDLDKDIFDNLNYNWGRFMFGLKTYSETGEAWPVVKKD